MQKVRTTYHVGQDEIHFQSCSIHPNHQHLIQLYLEPKGFASGKESFISIIQLMWHFFLCFVVSSATSRVNLVYTHQINASNVSAHHSHKKEQQQYFKNISIRICFLLQRLATTSFILTSENATIKIHPLSNNKLCCSVSNKFQPPANISFVLKIALKADAFLAATKLYEKISEERRHTVALQSKVVVQGYNNCTVQKINTRTTDCIEQYVQYEIHFSTMYSIYRHKLLVNKQHKYIVDGIDYMHKKFTINIYKNSSCHYGDSNTIDWIDIKIYITKSFQNICNKAWTCYYYGKHHGTAMFSKNVRSSDNLFVWTCTTWIAEKKHVYHKTVSDPCCEVKTLCRDFETIIKILATWVLLLVKEWRSMTLNLQMLLILSLCIPIVSSSHSSNKYSTNIIKTKYGPLRGIVIYSNPIVEAFLGVPYASPPVGSLRYMPPVTPSTWKTTRLADHFSPVCPQALPKLQNGNDGLFEHTRGRLAHLRRLLPLLSNQSEDCLYLNLYVPRSAYTIVSDEIVSPYIHSSTCTSRGVKCQ